MKTIAFLGKSGGKLRGICDLEWIVPGFGYSDRIQEAHMAAIHIIIEMVEKSSSLRFSAHEVKLSDFQVYYVAFRANSSSVVKSLI